MIATNRFFISMALGIALGAVGVIIVGLLAAVAIPVEFFTWFDQHSSIDLARFLIAFLMQLLGFGLLAILLGQTLGKTKHWLSNCLISYLSMLSYVAVLDASNPFKDLTIESLTFAIVPLVCLVVSAYRSHQKYNNKLASVLNLSRMLGKKG